MTKLKMKEISKALSTPGTKFTISGDNMLTHKVFKVGDGYVTEDKFLGTQMNISYIGATKMDLYTFDMLGKKSKGTIFFDTVTIVK